MRWLPWAGLGLIGAGVALLAAGMATGQGQVYLFFIFPVYAGTGVLPFLGVLCIFVGLVAFLLGASFGGVPIGADIPETVTGATPAPPAAPPRYGGVVMVGPVPLAFGSDKEFARAMMVLGVVAGAIIVILWVFLLIAALR